MFIKKDTAFYAHAQRVGHVSLEHKEISQEIENQNDLESKNVFENGCKCFLRCVCCSHIT